MCLMGRQSGGAEEWQRFAFRIHNELELVSGRMLILEAHPPRLHKLIIYQGQQFKETNGGIYLWPLEIEGALKQHFRFTIQTGR